ncbi:MAG: 2,3-bisphosphoglycerate-independent phosphoglycerate mutase [Candidatus Micrarchaeia archaeon]
METTKGVLIVCDGLGDLPVGGKTPLQRARKPNLDRLAEEGACGLLHAIGVGITPGSDTSHLALLGYDPETYYRGRGPFEALGMGVRLEHGDIAFRCNFATVDERWNVVDRRAGRIKEGGGELGKALDGMEIDGVKVVFVPSVEHRAALVLRGEGLSPKVSDTDPHGPGKVQESKPLDASPEARRTADVLNKFTRMAYERLRAHPLNVKRAKNNLPQANIVLARGAGMFERVPSLKERFGITSACVAGGALYKGVASYVGMELIDVPGATGRTDSNLRAKAVAALAALSTHDFVFLHVKGTDSASHDGDLKEKVAMIERIDKMVGMLMREARDAHIAITSDHSTPVSLRDHSWHPTPIALWGPRVRRDGVKRFDELACGQGALGHLRGLEVLPLLLAHMGRTKMYGS